MIASDRPPQELRGLEERLVSRFRWGSASTCSRPTSRRGSRSCSSRREREASDVPDDVIEFVASKFDQIVRELEGALVRVVAWSELTAQPIDQELAERALQDLIPQTEHEIPPAAHHGGDRAHTSRCRPATSYRSPARDRSRQARHIAMYLMRECTGLSLVKIGEIFGGRDHTTVLHGINEGRGRNAGRGSHVPPGPGPTRIVRGRMRGTS